MVFMKSTRKPMARLKVPYVVPERLRPNGHVKVASGVALKRPRTNRHVKSAGGIVSKRTGTHGGIVDPSAGNDTVQRVYSQSCVSTPGHVLGQSCALRGGESAKQQSAIASVKKPQRNGERLLDLIRVFIFLVYWSEVALLKA